MILQNFTFDLVDKSYQLKIKETLTIKPDNLKVYVTSRAGREQLSVSLAGKAVNVPPKPQEAPAIVSGASRPATIAYGSNSGTCEALSYRIAVDLGKAGHFLCKVKTLDALVGDIPRGEPIIIVTGSYDGGPPGNAIGFMKWLTDLEDGTLTGASHVVFGCGMLSCRDCIPSTWETGN